MKKIVLKYGLIAGGIITVLMIVVMVPFWDTTHDFEGGEVAGYASMILALSTVFFGVKAYRDQERGGQIGFWKAVQVGLAITVVASIIYVIVWKIYSSIAFPDFMDKYVAHMEESMKKSGASAAEILKQKEEMLGWKELMKNPLVEMGMVFMEIFPVGLLMSLIAGAFLRKKKTNSDPANSAAAIIA
jgi:hypothetical protein